MAAVVLAEGFIRPERLKPWWRLWAYPAPQLSSAGKLQGLLPGIAMSKQVLTGRVQGVVRPMLRLDSSRS